MAERHRLEAAIFDMDGLMVDTEYLHHKSFEMVLREQGISPIPNEHGVIHVSGISAEANWRRFMQIYDFEGDPEELNDRKKNFHLTLLEENLIPMPGLLELLTDLDEHGVKKAVASSSPREHIDIIVERLGIASRFAIIVAGEDVTNGKPAPDIFIRAANELAVSPENCVVFEDAIKGVEAAKAARMRIVVVPNRFTAHEDFSLADRVVASMVEVNTQNLTTLFD